LFVNWHGFIPVSSLGRRGKSVSAAVKTTADSWWLHSAGRDRQQTGGPMPAHHDDLTLTSGDSWLVPFSITDINGNALDLTWAEFQWVLLGPSGLPVQNINPTITVTAPIDGKGQIEVSSTETSQIPVGRYCDSMRVVIADQVSTTWTGYFLINANPFFAP
jgi:hypothetical protein